MTCAVTQARKRPERAPKKQSVALGSTSDVLGACKRPGGLPEIMTSRTVFADVSTMDPAPCRRLAELFAECGIEAIDAPVSGGERAAIEGTLFVMAGGTEEAVERDNSFDGKTTVVTLPRSTFEVITLD